MPSAAALLAARARLDAPGGETEVEASVARLALELTGAAGACLAVLDERGEPARLVTAGDAPPGDADALVPAARAGRLDVGELALVAAPVLVAGGERAWLCATRPPPAFAAGEHEALAALAGWAGLALENAALRARIRLCEQQLARAVRGVQAARSVSDVVSTEPRLDLVLERIVEEAGDLVDARTVLALLVDGDELAVAAQAGTITRDVRGLRVPRQGTLLGAALTRGAPVRSDTLTRREIWGTPDSAGRGGGAGLVVPMTFRGEALGVLAAVDRRHGDAPFTADDERELRSFAASAASAVAGARTVAEDRMRRTVEATEQERRRWARELHDETLQGLGVLRIGLTAALARPGADREAAMGTAVDGLAEEIARLRALIDELRPAGLDEIGLEHALHALAERTRRAAPLAVDVAIALDDGTRLPPDREVLAYRIVQEALTNVLKHARARRVRVEVARGERRVDVAVTDDGVGFDPRARADGVGLLGMRERVALAGGTLRIESRPGAGTSVRSAIPV